MSKSSRKNNDEGPGVPGAAGAVDGLAAESPRGSRLSREYLPALPTRLAYASWKEHRFRGRLLFGEILGQTSFWQLWSFALDGPVLQDGDEKVLDALAICNSAADPRIPPMKLIRLLSSYGGVMAAIGAAFVAQEKAWIGTWTLGSAARDLVDIADVVGVNPSTKAIRELLDAWFVKGRRLRGFGIPARPQDERVAALRRYLEERRRLDRPFWRLLQNTAEIMQERARLPVNIAAASAASALDIGFTPHQIGILAIAFAQHAFVGNAVEGAAQAPAVLRELPAGCVDYVGPPPRLSPRAAAAGQRLDDAADAADEVADVEDGREASDGASGRGGGARP